MQESSVDQTHTLNFFYQVMRESYQELKEPPEDGCYIRGMFAEGARWDYTRHLLADSRPKELFTDMPVIWLIPASNRQVPEQGIYDCPVYKTLTRAGECGACLECRYVRTPTHTNAHMQCWIGGWGGWKGGDATSLSCDHTATMTK